MFSPRTFYLLLIMSLPIPAVSLARDVAPFVSTDWLEQNLSLPKLIVIDTRAPGEYRKGHIANTVNLPLSSWAVNRNGLFRELPADSDLLAIIGSAGIKEDSTVVVVGKGESDFDRADAIRVAWTLLIAGVKNASVLDGGYAKWLKEKKSASSEQTAPAAGEYSAKINQSAIVSKSYVLGRIGKSIIVDTRTPELFFGMTTEIWAPKPGHIKSAINLPTPWVFKDGILKSINELEGMANGVIGENKSQEIIVYCGVGPYAAVWCFILTELLGYKNVKLYDGSMQEWVMDPAGPVTIFSWH